MTVDANGNLESFNRSYADVLERMEKHRIETRRKTLLGEFDNLRDTFALTFHGNAGRTYTITLGELFEQFELVRQRNESQS